MLTGARWGALYGALRNLKFTTLITYLVVVKHGAKLYKAISRILNKVAAKLRKPTVYAEFVVNFEYSNVKTFR